MAGGKGDGDRSIGSSHILGLFFGTVLLCCIFFVLGFVMGRDQARTSNRVDMAPKAAATESTPPPGWSVSSPAASTPAAERPAEPAAEKAIAAAKPVAKPVTKPVEKPAAPLAPPKKAPAPEKKPAAAGKYSAPLIPKGAIVIQIAALTKAQDALAMAAALQDHGFPTFVLEPVSDKYYRVQVGPYADAKSADQAKRALEQEGFKVIIKR